MISVLYVDDEPGLLELGREFLQMNGDFRVDLLTSAGLALEQLKTHTYDAIISDYQMPVMDGLEFLKQVRLLHGQIPFILFTGRGREEVVILALNLGADFYLQKGGDPRPQFAELAHKVRQAVQRRQAEISLQESERRYRDVVEKQTEFISRFRPDGTHVFANEAYCRHFKKTYDEIIGHRFVPSIPEEDRTRVRRHFASFTPDRPVADIEHRVIMPDGSIRWHWWNDHAFFDHAGRVTEYQSLGKDITKRKQVEEALQQERNFTDAVLDSVPGLLYVYDDEGHLRRWNKQHETLTGYPAEELAGKHVLDWFRHDETSMADIRDGVERAFREGHGSAEGNLMTKSGTVIPFYFTATRLDIGGRKYFTGIGIDITERKRAMEALRESEEKFRTLFDNMQEGIAYCHMLYDNEGRPEDFIFLNVNAAFNRIIGLPALVNKRVTEVIPGVREAFPEVFETYGRVVLTGKPEVFNLNFSSIDKWLNISVYSPAKEHFVTVFTDITEQKRAEDELRQNEAKGRDLAELLPQMVFEMDTDFTITYANRHALTVFGITEKDLEHGIPALSFIEPSQHAQVKENAQKQLNGIFDEPHEYTALRKDGSTFQVIIYTSPIYRNTIITGLRGVIVDISAQRKAQEELRESENKFRTIFENSPYPISINSLPDHKFIAVNAAFRQSSGYTDAEILGKNPVELGLLSLVDTARLAAHLLASGRIENMPIALTAKGGQRVHVQFSTIPITMNDRRAIVTITAEVTKLKRVEEELLQDYDRLSTKERALRENQQKLRAVLDHLPDLVLVHRDGIILYVNPAMQESLGIRPDEVLKKPILDYIAPEYHPRVADAVRERIKTGRDHPYEIELLRRQGGRMTVLIRGSLIEFDGSRAILNVLTDVTERRKAERALLESEEKFRSYVENANDIIYSLTPGGIFTYVSPRWTELLGHDAGEVIGKSFDFVIHPDDLPACHEFVRQIMTTGDKKGGIEYRIRHKNGTWYWHTTTASPLCDAGGNIVSYLGICRDITDRKHAELALRASEAKYRAIIENMQDLVYQTDPEGNLTMISPAGARLSGYASPAEMIGKNIARDIYADPEEREQFLSALREKGEVRNYPITLLDRYGIPFHVTASSHFYSDDQGKVLGVEGVLHDVTGQRKAEEAVRQANKKLSLLSGITRHDISNQLMTLNGFVALLHNKIPDPALENYFSRIKKASSQIDAMIRFTKEYEEIGVHAPVWQDLQAMVNSTGKDGMSGKVVLKNDIPSGTEVFADPLIVRVFFNLMDNAIRHGGRITTVRFSSETRNGDRIIICEDDGDGVVTKEKERIFDRGFGKNTGFGLAISREILDITGITITENGEPGRGARFEIVVPEGAYRVSGG